MLLKCFCYHRTCSCKYFSPDIRLVRHAVLDILVRDIPVEDVRLVDDVPKEKNEFNGEHVRVQTCS